MRKIRRSETAATVFASFGVFSGQFFLTLRVHCASHSEAATTAKRNLPVASGPLEKKAAPVPALVIRRQSRHANRHFSTSRAQRKRFRRWSALRRRFLGK